MAKTKGPVAKLRDKMKTQDTKRALGSSKRFATDKQRDTAAPAGVRVVCGSCYFTGRLIDHRWGTGRKPPLPFEYYQGSVIRYK